MLSFLSVLTVAVLNAGELCLVARGSRANTNKVQSISTLVPHTRHISAGSALSGDGRLRPCSSASMSKKRILKVGLIRTGKCKHVSQTTPQGWSESNCTNYRFKFESKNHLSPFSAWLPHNHCWTLDFLNIWCCQHSREMDNHRIIQPHKRNQLKYAGLLSSMMTRGALLSGLVVDNLLSPWHFQCLRHGHRGFATT